MVSIAPEAYGAIEVISHLKEKILLLQWLIAMLPLMKPKRGINHGVTVATHLFNGMKRI